MSYRRLNFVTLYGAYLLLGSALNVAEDSQKLCSLLTGWAPSFEELLNWLQFEYITEQTGTYVAPASTFLVQYEVLELDPLLHLI